MTEKQKQAIKVLNNLMATGVINDEDFFVLMEFVVDKRESITVIPWHEPYWTSPDVPWWVKDGFGETICDTAKNPPKSTLSDATAR